MPTKSKTLSRRMTRYLLSMVRETDYLTKLNQKDYEFMIQFLFEYYQADFNFLEPIHGPEYLKDCRDRNNASKRQMHSVGTELREEAERKARVRAKGSNQSRYYTPDDYDKDI